MKNNNKKIALCRKLAFVDIAIMGVSSSMAYLPTSTSLLTQP